MRINHDDWIPPASLAPWLVEYIHESRPHPRRHLHLRNMEKHFRRTGISRTDLLDWFADIQERYSGSTINLYRSCVSSFCRWCYESGRIQRNPFSRIPRAREKPVQWEMVKPEHVARVVQSANGHCVAWMLVLLFHTGMAFVDGAKLQWSEVDIEAGFIRKTRKKSGESCIIPLDKSGVLFQWLVELYHTKDETARIFPSDPRKGIHYVQPSVAKTNPQVQSYNLYKFCEAAHVPRFRWHDIRRTYCSVMANSGVPTLVAMKATGHKTFSCFQKYVKIEEDKIRTEVLGALQIYDTNQVNLPGMARPIPPPRVPLVGEES